VVRFIRPGGCATKTIGNIHSILLINDIIIIYRIDFIFEQRRRHERLTSRSSSIAISRNSLPHIQDEINDLEVDSRVISAADSQTSDACRRPENR
jgi:hypothetical protein